MSLRLRIATRTSALAMWQARHVTELLHAALPDCEVTLVPVRTEGDRDQQSRLDSFGGTGVFTREVQHAVLDERADLAVHSLKDLPTEPVTGLVLAAVPARGPRRDVLCLAAPAGPIDTLNGLAEGARVATGSPRRRAQLLALRPDLEFVTVRGNVGTRLNKMDEGLCDAMLLAEAGLRRLELEDRISFVLAPSQFLPAVGQGALGLECRSGDERTREVLAKLRDESTTTEVTAERTLLAELRAGCHAPLGVWARCEDESKLTVDAVLSDLDGTQQWRASDSGPPAEAAEIGCRVAEALRAQSG